MADITSEVNSMTPEQLEALKLKYEDLHIKPAFPYTNKLDYIYLKLIGIASAYIKKRHNDINLDLKSWAVFVVTKFFEYQKVKTAREILAIVNDFIKYWSENYEEYSKDIVFSCSDFDRDSPFVTKYLTIKMQGE